MADSGRSSPRASFASRGTAGRVSRDDQGVPHVSFRPSGGLSSPFCKVEHEVQPLARKCRLRGAPSGGGFRGRTFFDYRASTLINMSASMPSAARPFDDIRALLAQDAKGRRGGAGGGARARGATDQACWLARAARGDRRVDGGLAGIGAAACQQSAGRGLRRQPRRRRPGGLGVSGLGHRGDGGEFHRRRRRDQPDLQDLRHFAQGLRTRAGKADRRHHPGAGARREGLRGDDGLRHGGAGLRAGPPGPGRDGHRQHHAGGGDLSRALRRRGRGMGRPRDRRRR